MGANLEIKRAGLLDYMWMKPGMWQYVDYARVSCVVNVLSVDALENPIVMKLLSRQYLGKVLIWLLTGQNLCHTGVILD